MNQQGRPNEQQLVYRRDPETGQPVGGLLRWGLIPHFCEARPDFAPIHARAETVAENEWFSDAYRKPRCVVPTNNFFSERRRRQTARDFPVGRRAFRRRWHLGELAQSLH
jgi:putative SOS response-associated peptidase YedK